MDSYFSEQRLCSSVVVFFTIYDCCDTYVYTHINTYLPFFEYLQLDHIYQVVY